LGVGLWKALFASAKAFESKAEHPYMAQLPGDEDVVSREWGIAVSFGMYGRRTAPRLSITMKAANFA
jgi:hypothetical protein